MSLIELESAWTRQFGAANAATMDLVALEQEILEATAEDVSQVGVKLRVAIHLRDQRLHSMVLSALRDIDRLSKEGA